MAALLRFSEFSADGWACQGIAVHGEDHQETVNSVMGLVKFLEDLCPAATVLDIRFQTFGSQCVKESNLL